MSQMSQQWELVKTELRRDVGDASYNSWIDQLSLASWNDGVVTLRAPSRFVCDRVETDYGAQIKAAVTRNEPKTKRVVFKVGERGSSDAERRAIGGGQNGGAVDRQIDAVARASQIAAATREAEGLKTPSQAELRQEGGEATLETGLRESVEERLDRLRSAPLNARFRFDNFVVGRPNELAYVAAKRVAEDPKPPFNPIFIYGQPGVGKTHLLHSIAQRRKELHPHENVLFISAEAFLYEFINAVRRHDTLSFKKMFRSVDMLLVDDIQHIMGKNYTQEEFFHTFNVLAEQGRHIVLSGDRSPADMDTLDERLRSRLGCGLVADIHPSDYELRLGILECKLEQERERTPTLKVDRKVLDFLAHRISMDVRVLEGAFNRLIAIATMMDRPVTIEMAQRELQDLLRHSDRKVTIEEIQRRVAEHFNIRLSDMHSPRRARAVARPRQIAMYLCKQLTQKSLPDIGQKFGGRDHTTVLHAVKKVTQLREVDSLFDDDVERLRRALEG